MQSQKVLFLDRKAFEPTTIRFGDYDTMSMSVAITTWLHKKKLRYCKKDLDYYPQPGKIVLSWYGEG
jgi:hypothetical protein